MPINVVCRGCKKRFQVSDQFAGKEGPCPKCKKIIKIPAASEEVVVHEPEQFGPKGAGGKAVLQPIFKEYPKYPPVVLYGGIAVAVVALILAVVIRFGLDEGQSPPMMLLAIGAILLAPPVVYAGYLFLHDDEKGVFTGQSLYARIAVCALVYPIMWGVYAIYKWYLLDGEMAIFHLVIVIPLMAAGGTVCAFASFDFEWPTAATHFGFYMLVTVVLRVIMMGLVL